MAITLILLAAFAVPVAMAVACVVIARHLYPPGQRLWSGLAGAGAAIGLPLLVIHGIREWTGLRDRLPGEAGPLLALVAFAAASLAAPAALIWWSRRRPRP